MSKLVLLLTLVLSLPLFGQTAPPASGDARISVVRSDDNGVVIRVSGLRVVAGGAATAVELNARLSQVRTDSTSLPGLQVRVAVPPTARDFAVSMAGDGRTIVPFGSVRRSSGNQPSVAGEATIRRLRTVVITAWPLQPVPGGLAVDSAFTLTLTWLGQGRGDAGRTRSASAAPEIPAVAQALRSLVVNYDQAARMWRTPAAATSSLAAAAGSWGLGEAIVLAPSRDGIHRVDAGDLFSSGASSLRDAAVQRLALTTRGRPVAMYVADADGDGRFGGADFIEFVAERNRSIEGFYYDEITDTNAYVLSWDGRAVSPRLADTTYPTVAPTLTAYDSTLHFERDLVPILGFTWPDALGGETHTVHVPEYVDGEGLYWRSFNSAPFVETVTFDCAPSFARDGMYLMRVRLANRGGEPVTLNLTLNEYGDLGDIVLAPRNDTIVSLSVPANLLLNGRNALRILGSAAPVMKAALDWIELTGRWMPTTFTSGARLTMPTDARPGEPLRVRLTGVGAGEAIVHTSRNRIVVDSSASGTLLRLTSRSYFEGSARINRGFIAQLGEQVIASEPWWLGIVMAEISPAGAVVRSDHFRVFDQPAEFARAEEFLRSVPVGSIVVAGTSAGFGTGTLPAGLASELTALGSTVPGRPGLANAAWAFAARKGAPSTAREAYDPMTGPESRGVTLDAFVPSAAGRDRLIAATVAGAAGEEIVIGAPARLGDDRRYHAADRLVSGDNRADLIVITHPKFRAAAERLAAHRRTHGPARNDSFAVRIVEIYDIYDEFNEGVKHPRAIRRFLQYADSNWAAPSPAYVLLFGDASFDPQRRLENARMVDYIPTYGEPASDYLFTVPYNGVDTDSPNWTRDSSSSFNQFIGRLPAMTVADAEAMVDKIIDYDTTAPARWHKRAVFIAGGGNEGEVTDNRQLSSSLAEYIGAPWFRGDTSIVFRRDFGPLAVVPPHPDALWAQSEMSAGALWVNSAGHGSRTVLDLDFGFPDQIDNGSRYFVLSTFSCQTGAFSDHEQSLRNEDFVKAPGRGAIAAYGSTGWTFTDVNTYILRNLFDLLTSVPINNLGALSTLAKWIEFAPFAEDWPDRDTSKDGFRRRNHLLTYSLLGDPSMDLRASELRELAFEDPIFASPRGGEPSVADSIVELRVRLWNYGRPIFFNDDDIDSVITVVASITNRARVEVFDTVEVRWLDRYADIVFDLPIDRMPGEYTIRIEADPLRDVIEGYRDDNVRVLSLRVRGNEPLPLEPMPYGRVAAYDDVSIRLLNPPSGPGAEFIVDTVPSFDSPAAFASASLGTISSDELTTTWRFSIPVALRGATTFWWRATATSGDPEVARLFPLTASFTVQPEATAEFIQRGAGQLREADISELALDDRGVGPGSRNLVLRVSAIGQTFYPGGLEIMIPKVRIIRDAASSNPREIGQANGRPGLQIMLLDTATLQPVAYRNFVMYDRPDQVDEFIAFADSLPASLPVIVATSGRSFDALFQSPRRADLVRALTSLGSTVAERLGPQDSYALIAGKGLPVLGEAWIGGDSLDAILAGPTGYAEVTTSASFAIVPRPGSLQTGTIGPATAWRRAVIEHPIGAARPDIVVLGLQRDGRRDTLSIWRRAEVIGLSDVDPQVHPRIELLARFGLDSTMRLIGYQVEFDPSPELAVVPGSIAVDRDSVMQGDPATLSVTVANLSRTRAASSVETKLRLATSAGPRIVGTSTVNLEPLARRVMTFPIITDRLERSNVFAFVLNPDDRPAEPYRTNNADSIGLRTGVDTRTPSVVLYADGVRVMDGDYVSPTARFDLRLLDNSRLLISDSASIRMFIDLEEITHDSGAVFEAYPGDGEHRASFLYAPPAPGLSNGEHTITFQATDASGNRTASEFIRFRVERGLRLEQVVNFPNPFYERTEFTFMVVGDRPPVRGAISVYTVAGRRIKTIDLGPADLHLGFNRVEWNGLDADNDRIANGVYLYRIKVENEDGTIGEAIEKLVIMK